MRHDAHRKRAPNPRFEGGLQSSLSCGIGRRHSSDRYGRAFRRARTFSSASRGQYTATKLPTADALALETGIVSLSGQLSLSVALVACWASGRFNHVVEAIRLGGSELHSWWRCHRRSCREFQSRRWRCCPPVG